MGEAERLIQKSLAILEESRVTQGDPQFVSTLEVLAAILRNTNREREALEVLAAGGEEAEASCKNTTGGWNECDVKCSIGGLDITAKCVTLGIGSSAMCVAGDEVIITPANPCFLPSQ